MAGINTFLYSEIDLGDGVKIPIGSMVDPMSLTPSGTLQTVQGKWSAITAATQLWDSATSALSFLDGFYFKSNIAGVVSMVGSANQHNSSVHVPANVWVWFPGGQISQYSAAGGSARASATVEDITEIWYYPDAAASSKPQFVGYADV